MISVCFMTNDLEYIILSKCMKMLIGFSREDFVLLGSGCSTGKPFVS